MRRTARLLLVVITAIGVVMLFVFPARTLIEQRQEIATTEQHIAAIKQENAQLAAQNRAASTPAEIEQIAHQQFGMVMPGQKAYTIIPKTEPKKRTVEKAATAHHWWQSFEFWR